MDHYWSTYHSTDRGRHCYLPVFHAGILSEEDIQRLNRPLRRKTNTAQYKV